MADSDAASVSSDDETTIAAEEALEPEVDPDDEIRLLAEDLNVDVAELCSGGRGRRDGACAGSPSPPPPPQHPGPELDSDPDPDLDFESELTTFYLVKVAKSVQRLSSEEEDDEYVPLKQTTSEIRVGSQFQAEVGGGDEKVSGSEAQDELMWRPRSAMSESELIAYEAAADHVIRSHRPHRPVDEPPADSDISMALKCLLESEYVVQDALQLLVSQLKTDANRKEDNNF